MTTECLLLFHGWVKVRFQLQRVAPTGTYDYLLLFFISAIARPLPVTFHRGQYVECLFSKKNKKSLNCKSFPTAKHYNDGPTKLEFIQDYFVADLTIFFYQCTIQVSNYFKSSTDYGTVPSHAYCLFLLMMQYCKIAN